MPICTQCGFQTGDVSEEQMRIFLIRKLRDRIYHLKMISYVVISALVVAFGWYWWDSEGFINQSSIGPFILMSIAAVVYVVVRALLFRNRRQQKALRQKSVLRPKSR